MAWVAPVAGAAAGIIGDLMSQSGQQSTNAQNMALQMQMENWQEKMADTAVQRRMGDLKQAGVNPLLAVPGSIAPANVGSVGMATMQNPSGAFSNMGGQVSTALQLAGMQSQIRKTNADAAFTEAQTPGDVVPLNADGTPDFTRANGGVLGNLSATQAAANIRLANAAWDKTQQDIKTGQASAENLQTLSELNRQNPVMVKQFHDALVQQQVADAKSADATLTSDQAMAKVMGSSAGPVIAALEKIMGLIPFHGSASVTKTIR